MQETTFFEYGSVRITNARFIVDGQTFAMNGVTSIAAVEERPNRIVPILLIVVGVPPVFSGFYVGLAFSLVGVIWCAMQKSTYYVVLRTASGQRRALKTYQKEYLQQVIAALNNAIVHRG